jgi:hypothetical protein
MRSEKGDGPKGQKGLPDPFVRLLLAGLILFWGVVGGLFQWLLSVNHHRRTEAHSS